jgi:hypothetical protein
VCTVEPGHGVCTWGVCNGVSMGYVHHGFVHGVYVPRYVYMGYMYHGVCTALCVHEVCVPWGLYMGYVPRCMYMKYVCHGVCTWGMRKIGYVYHEVACTVNRLSVASVLVESLRLNQLISICLGTYSRTR